MIFERFICERCGRDDRDLPIDDGGPRDASIFEGDDGSCCRKIRADIARRQVEGILVGWQIRTGRFEFRSGT